jgi:hypothetical protein
VKSGDTLSTIAGRLLGNPKRWNEIYALNRDLIGSNPNQIRVGMTLKLPGGAPVAVEPPAPAAPQPAPKTEKPEKKEPQDRYAPGTRPDTDKRWTVATAEEFAAFVDSHTEVLRAQGVEIDCADFAVKLLKDFCESKGIPNPLEGKGTWHQYAPGRSGGLPNVNGPTYHLAGIHADNLAKDHTTRINDADGDGIRGYDPRTGKVDVQDLRAGDILFYDWDGNGIVNHTVNVIGVSDDGTVTLAFGTYDNLRPGEPLRWENLDFKPVERLVLEPGTKEYEKWLGEGNGLFAARRYNWMPDHKVKTASKPEAKPEVKPEVKPAEAGSKPPAEPAPAEPAPVVTPPPSGLDNLLRILRGE